MAALASGCGEPTPVVVDPPADVPEVPAPPTGVPGVDAGYVEVTVTISGSLLPQADTPSIQVEELVAQRNKNITVATIDVAQPYPAGLPLEFTVAGNDAAFAVTPVLMRGRILRDDTDELGTFTTVLAGQTDVRGGRFEADALQGLNTLPETMLVVAEAETLLLPPGTDVDAIDVATVATTPNRTTTLRSNPIRINFVDGAAPRPSPPNASTAPSASGAAASQANTPGMAPAASVAP